MNTISAIAAEFIQDGVRKSGIQLTHNLEAYLTITFSKYLDRGIEIDRLTVRITNAMDNEAPRDILRGLADECLIGCSFFEHRLARAGKVRHYVGMGQVAYDAAGMAEQAYGFVHMRDVMAQGVVPTDAKSLIDRALSGSIVAKQLLLKNNVVAGPWGKQKWL